MSKSSISTVSFNSHANCPLKLFYKVGYSDKLFLRSKEFFCRKHCSFFFKATKGISLMTIDAIFKEPSGNNRYMLGSSLTDVSLAILFMVICKR